MQLARHKGFQGSTPQLTGAPNKVKERITPRRKDAKSSIHQCLVSFASLRLCVMKFSCPLTRGAAALLLRNGNKPHGLVVIRSAIKIAIQGNLLETGLLQKRLELRPRVDAKRKTKFVSAGFIEHQPAIVDR